MQPSNVPVECVPVPPIKTQVENIAFDIRLRHPDINGATWNRYPCRRETEYPKCVNDHCDGKVSFCVTYNAKKEVKILTLLFNRSDKEAYVCFNQQLRSLFDDNILPPVPPVTIHVQPPVIQEPTTRVSYV